MPSNTISYDNTFFYKIVCKDVTVEDLYVGHTTNFVKRKTSHKSNCMNTESRDYNMFVYRFIREKGGWENWDMILIDRTRCEDKLDATRKERKYIEEFHATLNCHIPSKTKQEWTSENRDRTLRLKKENYIENRTEILEKSKSYYVENLAKCKSWKNGIIQCECGHTYTNANKARHYKSQRHKSFSGSSDDSETILEN
jgi:hypothetical protein